MGGLKATPFLQVIFLIDYIKFDRFTLLVASWSSGKTSDFLSLSFPPSCHGFKPWVQTTNIEKLANNINSFTLNWAVFYKEGVDFFASHFCKTLYRLDQLCLILTFQTSGRVIEQGQDVRFSFTFFSTFASRVRACLPTTTFFFFLHLQTPRQHRAPRLVYYIKRQNVRVSA